MRDKMPNNFPTDSNWFEEALEDIGETAANHNAIAVLTDHCLGCGSDKFMCFYNPEEGKYNTVVLDFDNNMAQYLEKTMPNIVILICNVCKASYIEEELLKRNLIRMTLEGIAHKFENDNENQDEEKEYDDFE